MNTNQFSKEDLADMLREIGQYEQGFKARAFINAADFLICMTEEKFNQVEDFTKLPGIGRSVNTCIKEFIETGQMTRLTELRNKLNNHEESVEITQLDIRNSRDSDMLSF